MEATFREIFVTVSILPSKPLNFLAFSISQTIFYCLNPTFNFHKWLPYLKAH